MDDHSASTSLLTPSEELELYHLRMRKFLADQGLHSDGLPLSEDEVQRAKALSDKAAAGAKPRTTRKRRTEDEHQDTQDETWNLLGDKTLLPWQQDCREQWFEARDNKGSIKGTVKVVTGAGKTVLALAIMQQLQEENRNLHVAIVVPSIVLMEQWYQEIVANSNLQPWTVGRLGGGYTDSYADGMRVLICVLKSAAVHLPKIASGSEITENLLLVVDECHRAGSTEMSKVFATRRTYTLGLSATPEREESVAAVDDSDEEAASSIADYSTSILGNELGPIIYDMTLSQADAMGLLPTFTIYHYGLPLTPDEKTQYDALSAEIHKLQDELQGAQDRHASRASFFSHCQVIAKQEGPASAKALRFISLTSDRKRLLYGAAKRREVAASLIKQKLEGNRKRRIIVFHESIEEVTSLYLDIVKLLYNDSPPPVTVEHSGLPRALRDTGISLFREGVSQVLVSARSLVEGFNVPRADVGIIAASSASIRQRIQTLGRVLRRPIDGGEKHSEVHVLYCSKTTDESIYRKADWALLTGTSRNVYYDYAKGANDEEQSGPPLTPLPKEAEIDPSTLEPGCQYPGAYEGTEYTCRSDLNVYTTSKMMAVNPQGLPERIKQYKGSFGRFKVTPQQKYILALRPRLDEDGETVWETIFVDKLLERFVFQSEGTMPLAHYQPGDVYPHELVGRGSMTLSFRRFQGKMAIMSKGSKGSLMARGADRATNKEKGQAHDHLQNKIQELMKKGYNIRELIVLENHDVLFADTGYYRYICKLNTALEFPS